MYEKEIGKLSIQELRSLDPGLREHVGEQLLDRFLAEQGHVDLIERGHVYTKKVGELTPTDLPALVEADRYRAEEGQRKRGREKFIRDVQEDLERLHVRREGWPINCG